MLWLLWIPGALLAAYIAYTMYLATVLKWEDEQTVGLAYYGLPLAGRNAFKERLRAHARRLRGRTVSSVCRTTEFSSYGIADKTSRSVGVGRSSIFRAWSL